MQSESVDKNAAPEGSSKNTKESKAAKKAERVTGIADNMTISSAFGWLVQSPAVGLDVTYCHMPTWTTNN